MKKQLHIFTILLSCFIGTQGQEINNLIHPSGYVPGTWGELGVVKEFGSGDKTMILLPGWGFDWTIFQPFIDNYKDQFKIYAVTFPGFGTTQAPPMPEDMGNFSDTQWTDGVIKGVKNLIKEEGIDKATIVSYFTYSNVIATRMALDYPELVERVILLSGMAKFTSNYISYEPASLQQRILYIEKSLAPHWFKTVSRQTWDEGNFTPEIFTKDSIKAKKYWDQMSSVPIPTMVRYLCEYYCTDLSLEYKDLKVPVLVVIPSFTNDILYDQSTSYVAPFFHYSWLGAKPASKMITIVTLTDSNAFILDDQPEKLFNLVDEFISDKVNRYQVVR